MTDTKQELSDEELKELYLKYYNEEINRPFGARLSRDSVKNPDMVAAIRLFRLAYENGKKNATAEVQFCDKHPNTSLFSCRKCEDEAKQRGYDKGVTDTIKVGEDAILAARKDGEQRGREQAQVFCSDCEKLIDGFGDGIGYCHSCVQKLTKESAKPAQSEEFLKRIQNYKKATIHLPEYFDGMTGSPGSMRHSEVSFSEVIALYSATHSQPEPPCAKCKLLSSAMDEPTPCPDCEEEERQKAYRRDEKGAKDKSVATMNNVETHIKEIPAPSKPVFSEEDVRRFADYLHEKEMKAKGFDQILRVKDMVEGSEVKTALLREVRSLLQSLGCKSEETVVADWLKSEIERLEKRKFKNTEEELLLKQKTIALTEYLGSAKAKLRSKEKKVI